jgi:hypothetical protein
MPARARYLCNQSINDMAAAWVLVQAAGNHTTSIDTMRMIVLLVFYHQWNQYEYLCH